MFMLPRWISDVRPAASLVMCAMLLGSGGCGTPRGSRAATPAVPTEPVLRVTQQVGGTHYRALVHNDAWFQTFGSQLLVLEPRSARVLNAVRLGPVGETGAAIDLLVHDEHLYVVLDSDAVILLELDDPRRPRVVERRSAEELSIAPKRVSVADGEVYVSGIGGVVRWVDNERVFRHLGEASRVVLSDEGLVTCIGRRIYRLADGRFVGSASDLFAADELGDGKIIFTRQSLEGAIVGLLGSDLRELDSRNLSVAVLGQVRNVRLFDKRIWVVSDSEVLAYKIEDGRLVKRLEVDILGARDIDRLDENHLALSGSFGRCIYRVQTNERGPGDSFLQGHREPSRLTGAKYDGRHILAGSHEGSWLYRIGSSVNPSPEVMDRGEPPPPPSTVATAAGARARISDDGSVLSITTDEGIFEHIEPDAQMHCVVAVDDEFWIGHDRGITVLRSRPSQDSLMVGSLRVDGPVRYLYPLPIGRGVAFVSEYGGFGTAQWVEEPIEVHARR